MGLKGGEHGCKAVLQAQFQTAFCACPTLQNVRERVGVERSETLAVLDGNVMVMAIPQVFYLFHEYIDVLVGQIAPALETAKHVVVVFDEPYAMTRAKTEEQRARDARRTIKTPLCSDDLVACIKTDEYDEASLRADGCNVRLLMDHRAARPRFYDALCAAVLDHFEKTTTAETSEWSLSFDGIDVRGANRPFGERRVAGILSNNSELWVPLLAREVPIGEGDLKLPDVAQRVHDAALLDDHPLKGVVLNLLCTIDTDSLVIELLKQTSRLARPDARDRNELTILCLREPSRKRKGDDFITPARYLCCNMATLHTAVCNNLYGTSNLSDSVAATKPAAVALLVGALASCGCDFLEVKGTRADVMIDVVREIVQKKPYVLGQIVNVFDPDPAKMLLAKTAISTVLEDYVDKISFLPRMQRSVASAKTSICDAQVLRAVWVVAYWLGREFKNTHEWGFASTSVGV